MRESYEYAKKGAADELGVEAPGTRRETMTIINQNAQAVVQKQMADLLFEVKTAVLSEVRKTGVAGASVPNVLAKATQSFTDFRANQVELGGSAAVMIAMNKARSDVFNTQRDKIAVYQYSALLDGKACPRCRAIDGSVVDYADFQRTPWKTPIHFRCRCLWVAIRKDQKDIPAVTGIPDAPAGSVAPDL